MENLPQRISIPFTKSFYKLLTGREASLTDLKKVNGQLYKSLLAILTTDFSGENQLEEYFFVAGLQCANGIEYFELKENGKTIAVTEENKEEFAELFANFYLQRSFAAELHWFKIGFDAVFPVSFLSIFTPDELEQLMYGTPQIDTQEWQRFTQYDSIAIKNSPLIKWFWEIVTNELPPQQVTQLLRFVTGVETTPFGGFSRLSPKFHIKINQTLTAEHLPTAVTCQNRLVLPMYTSQIELKEKLLQVLEHVAYFGLA